MPEAVESGYLLDWARDLGKEYTFLDFHVHPFDVLTGDTQYRSNEQVQGVFSRGKAIYQSPVWDEKSTFQEPGANDVANSSRCLLLAARLKYTHTGLRVFADQLDAAGISGALLLPVVRFPGSAESMLEAIDLMFPRDGRLLSACGFPVGLPVGKLFAFFWGARETYGIHAIKIHPNLAGVDALTHAGHDLLDVTLAAAGELGLPVVVHGGRTSALRPSNAAEFGLISHLETIDWNISTAPVIIAHAGCYELSIEEAKIALTKFEALLAKYPNLMADTSSLDPFILRMVLERISPDRLLFGSDALYVSILKAWLGFLTVLKDVSPHPDDDLIHIASLNAATCLKTCSQRINSSVSKA